MLTKTDVCAHRIAKVVGQFGDRLLCECSNEECGESFTKPVERVMLVSTRTR